MITGIDLSTKTLALAYIDDIACFTVELIQEGKYAEDRFDGLIRSLRKSFLVTNTDHVYVEAIPFMKSAKAALDLASVCGGIRAICVDLDISYTLVNNMTWKKGIGLKGRVAKEDTQALMRSTYNIEDRWILSENAFDALGVATYGYKQLSNDSSGSDTKDNLLEPTSQVFLGATTIKQGTEKNTTENSIQTK